MAKDQGEDFQLVLTRFVMERLLYRLSRSEFRDQFILKIKRNQLAPADLSLPEVIVEIQEFLQPPMDAAARGEAFSFSWPPGGPWRRISGEKHD